ncbi:DDE Tnp4 domain-containing protein [Trichonephila clavipes]|nr:DDE Tnp4 domain-containing protein [Trichonephila clavipes]
MDLVPIVPEFLDKQAQLSTEDADEIRLVTSIRWVVEAVNGQLKNWKALNYIIANVHKSYIGDYVKIVCAVLNAFHPERLNNIEDYNAIAHRMLDLAKKP